MLLLSSWTIVSFVFFSKPLDRFCLLHSWHHKNYQIQKNFFWINDIVKSMSHALNIAHLRKERQLNIGISKLISSSNKSYHLRWLFFIIAANFFFICIFLLFLTREQLKIYYIQRLLLMHNVVQERLHVKMTI